MFSLATLLAAPDETPKQLGKDLRAIEASFAAASAEIPQAELRQDLLPFFEAEEKASRTENPVKKIQAFQQVIEISQTFREKYREFLRNDWICSIRRSEQEMEILTWIFQSSLEFANRYKNSGFTKDLDLYQNWYQYLALHLEIIDDWEGYISEATYFTIEKRLAELISKEGYQREVKQAKQQAEEKVAFSIGIIDATAKAILWTIAQKKAILDRNRQWDEQFERDVASKKLEDFAREVMSDFVANDGEEIYTTRQLQEVCNALPDRDREQVNQCFDLLKTDPTHPLLHLKKVDKYWLARVSADYRLLGIETDNNIIWCWVGTQEEQKQIIDEESIDWLIEAVEEWSQEDPEYAREVDEKVVQHII